MKKKFIKKIIAMIVVLLLTLVNVSFADVGSFESYDSGSSSWDFDYDSGYDSSYDSSSSGGFIFLGGGLRKFYSFYYIYYNNSIYKKIW